MTSFFKILHRSKKTFARTGVIHTPHGDITTPAFVPVATQATIKGITMEEFRAIGASSLLCNTYHLYLRPGDKRVKRFGGLHAFMGWDGPIWTDSGGFQAFSLGAGMEHGVSKVGKVENLEYTTSSLRHTNKLEYVGMSLRTNNKSFVKISEDGVEFRSHIDGSEHFFTSERSMQVQKNLGADIVFAFDECTSPTHSYAYTKRSMERTHRWAKRSLREFQRLAEKGKRSQFLFGIIQGGDHKDLREQSAFAINAIDFDGVGIGGYVGDSKAKLYRVLDWVLPHCDDSKPRHLLGIGGVSDIFEAVERGVDTFDCVIPTRCGRNGTVLTREGMLHLGNAAFREDKRPIETGCVCYACSHATRAYLSHLFRASEMLGPILATIHNLSFVERLMHDIREAIAHNGLARVKRKYRKAVCL